jgi:NAD(P)-dependent dehydrogenase (short-subunit alcohol dehydrogenase family)
VKLRDRVAIVTGAGRGIGEAISLAFAREGADLALVSRTASEVLRTATEVEHLGRRAIAIRADVSEKKDVDKMVEQVIGQLDKVDILVNNAGILGPIGPMADNKHEDWIKAIMVNLVGTFLCCKAVLPFMIQQRKGKIINMSGGGAANPRPMFSAYSASKAAVVRLTETLSEEVKDYNIQVNAIAPGAVNTRMLDEVLAAKETAGPRAMAEGRRQKETGAVSPAVPAALAVFLASDDSDGITGRLISAVWDDWQAIAKQIPDIMSSDLYTLRRIDRPGKGRE